MPNANNNVAASLPSLSLSEPEDKLIDGASNVRRSIRRLGLDYRWSSNFLVSSMIKLVLQEYWSEMKRLRGLLLKVDFLPDARMKRLSR